MIRPFFEYYELIVYFRNNPARVQQAIDDKLPSAGNIAKKIAGDFQGFRDYLNDKEAINCLHKHQMGIAEKQAEEITGLKEHGIKVFKLNKNK